MVTREQFVREYTKAIRQGNAALFAGAGLSRPSGFVDWKELLRPLAENVGLNIDCEHDLTAVAQYIQNNSGNRHAINNSILEAFGKDAELNDNVRILTRLPIKTYWTTNYDCLIEDGLAEVHRKADVKIEYKQLPMTKEDVDAVVYKMHGDADHPADVVLTKDDYEEYDKTHPFFRDFLQVDLISKSFLFIGFSFEDPNLNFVLGRIKLSMGNSVRNHYCFVKKENEKNYEDKQEFQSRQTREKLREENLKKYGIKTVFVDDYKEIPDILKEVEDSVRANNVFISGSTDFYDNWSREDVERLACKLSNELVKSDFRVASGFGLGIGSSVIYGALNAIYSSPNKHSDTYLSLKPFPQNIVNAEERKVKWTKYREEILGANGVAIFMFGNKKDSAGKRILANGCRQEFEIAKQKGCMIIPIGSTGDMAAEIYKEVKADHEADGREYEYLDKYMDRLGTETDIDKIVEMVLEIVKARRKV